MTRNLSTIVKTIPAKIFWSCVVVVVIALAIVANAKSEEPTVAQKTRAIAQQLRCLECEGLSVYDSDTQTSKTILKDVERRVRTGESQREIFTYYEDAYGEYIRLAPPNKKGNWLIYVVPTFFVFVFIGALVMSIRKKSSRTALVTYWAVAGILFVSGLVVFVNNAKSDSKNQQTTQTQDDMSTLEKLQNAVDAEPTAGNYRNLAIVQFAQEDYVNALINFDAAAEVDDQDAESRAYGAYIVFLSGQFEAATARIEEAIAVKSDSVPALFFRGIIYLETPTEDDGVAQVHTAKANADFDRVLELAPDSEFARQINEVRAAE